MENTIVRMGLIGIGIVLIFVSIRLNSVKKLLVNHAVVWSLVGTLLILTGAVPMFSNWTRLLAPGTVTVLFAGTALILVTEFRNSITISKLLLQNRELAMQVALLNQECEILAGKLQDAEDAE